VTTVTAINRSGLRAGMVPLTPIHANWQEAYNYLSQTVWWFFSFYLELK